MQATHVDIETAWIVKAAGDVIGPHQRLIGAYPGGIEPFQHAVLAKLGLGRAQHRHLVMPGDEQAAALAEQGVVGEAVGRVEVEIARRPVQGTDRRRAVDRRIDRGLAACGVIAGLAFHFEQQHACIRRQFGRDRGPGDAGADYDDVEFADPGHAMPPSRSWFSIVGAAQDKFIVSHSPAALAQTFSRSLP